MSKYGLTAQGFLSMVKTRRLSGFFATGCFYTNLTKHAAMPRSNGCLVWPRPAPFILGVEPWLLVSPYSILDRSAHATNS
jgi:hypothetical protein